jgi:hypothetical protein
VGPRRHVWDVVGCAAIWGVGVWVCGCVGVWVCGCVGVWVCGVWPAPVARAWFDLVPGGFGFGLRPHPYGRRGGGSVLVAVHRAVPTPLSASNEQRPWKFRISNFYVHVCVYVRPSQLAPDTWSMGFGGWPCLEELRQKSQGISAACCLLPAVRSNRLVVLHL